MDNYAVGAICSVATMGLAGFCVYLDRERRNRNKLVGIYNRFLPDRDSCRGDFFEDKYKSITGKYVAELNKLKLWTPLARRTRKIMIETIKNPPPVLSISY